MIEDSPEGLSKTSKAVAILKKVGLRTFSGFALRAAALALTRTLVLMLLAVLTRLCRKRINESYSNEQSQHASSQKTAHSTPAFTADSVFVWSSDVMFRMAQFQAMVVAVTGGRLR